jgi:hypothetical protein
VTPHRDLRLCCQIHLYVQRIRDRDHPTDALETEFAVT